LLLLITYSYINFNDKIKLHFLSTTFLSFLSGLGVQTPTQSVSGNSAMGVLDFKQAIRVVELYFIDLSEGRTTCFCHLKSKHFKCISKVNQKYIICILAYRWYTATIQKIYCNYTDDNKQKALWKNHRKSVYQW